MTRKGTCARMAVLAAVGLALGCGSDDAPGNNTQDILPATGGTGFAGTLAAGNTAAGGTGGVASNPTGGSGATTGGMLAGTGAPPSGGTGAPTGGTGMATGGTGMATGGTGMATGGTGMATGGTGMPAGGTMAPPPGDWGTADPAMKGSYQTTTENNVGPDNAYTMFRPANLDKRHPLITWGNGTGTTPRTYTFLLDHLASHGFVIIASNNTNVAQGNPPLMVQGVTWVIEQNDDPSSPLYQHIDVDHVGATGHSQGAFATSTAAADPKVSIWAPIQGAARVSGQHGAGLLLCGGMDTTVPCSGADRAFNSINDLPVMYAELKAASHTNWFGGFGMVHPYVVAVTGWMRVHLMGDTELRSMFYGPSCTLCGDSAWVIKQKMMD